MAILVPMAVYWHLKATQMVSKWVKSHQNGIKSDILVSVQMWSYVSNMSTMPYIC